MGTSQILGISEKLATFILDYAEAVLGMVEELKIGIQLLNSMNVGAAMNELANAIRSDTKADDMRRRLLLELTTVKGGYIRERIARLLRRLDLVAEQTKEAARDLTLIPYFEIPASLKENIEKLTDDVHESVKTLMKSLEALMSNDIDTAIKCSRKVEDLEEDADRMFLNGKKLLIKHGEKIRNPAVVLMLFNFLQSLENVTDYSEDAGDYIRTLALRGRGEFKD